MGLPRIAVVFRFWQCDNENQAGVKGRSLTAPAKGSDLLAAFHPPQRSVSNEKKNCCCVNDRESSVCIIGR
jgi:hypothetical protein